MCDAKIILRETQTHRGIRDCIFSRVSRECESVCIDHRYADLAGTAPITISADPGTGVMIPMGVLAASLGGIGAMVRQTRSARQTRRTRTPPQARICFHLRSLITKAVAAKCKVRRLLFLRRQCRHRPRRNKYHQRAAACTTDADCAPNICGHSRFSIAQGLAFGADSFRRISFALQRLYEPADPAVFPAGTTSVIMSVKTDVNAGVSFSTFINTPYGECDENVFYHRHYRACGYADGVSENDRGHVRLLCPLSRCFHQYRERYRLQNIVPADAPSVVSGPKPIYLSYQFQFYPQQYSVFV